MMAKKTLMSLLFQDTGTGALFFLSSDWWLLIIFKDRDEIMEVLEGRMIFYIDGKELVTTSDDPPLLIPREHIHGFTVSK